MLWDLYYSDLLYKDPLIFLIKLVLIDNGNDTLNKSDLIMILADHFGGRFEGKPVLEFVKKIRTGDPTAHSEMTMSTKVHFEIYVFM